MNLGMIEKTDSESSGRGLSLRVRLGQMSM